MQSLSEDLLLLGRQTTKCWIVLQFAFLFRRWQVFVAPQPVSPVPRRLRLPRRLLPLRRSRRRGRMSLLSPVERTSIRQAGKRHRQRDRQTGGRQPTRPVDSLPHVPRV